MRACRVTGVVLGYNSNIGAATHAATQGACCALCQKNSKCKSWTYHDDKTCWLHPSIGPSHHEAGTVSGVPSGKLPPIPPPAPPHHGDSGMGVPSGPDACTPGTNGTQFKFCDHTLSMDARLDDLIQRVEVEEIALELTARQSEPIDRIGVPSYYWGTNAIHGMQNVQCLPASLGGKCPTSFAAPVTLAASFNMSLVKDMGNVIGRELRAYYNAKVHNSLDTWSPTININRDVSSGYHAGPVCSTHFKLRQYVATNAWQSVAVLAAALGSQRGVTGRGSSGSRFVRQCLHPGTAAIHWRRKSGPVSCYLEALLCVLNREVFSAGQQRPSAIRRDASER